jgi:hypothetical protein
VGSFQPSTITSFHHLEVGENIMDDELVNKFPHNLGDLLKDWYKPSKHFKTITLNEYHTISLRLPYQYVVAMVCRLYGELYSYNFKITRVPLIHYITLSRASFN